MFGSDTDASEKSDSTSTSSPTTTTSQNSHPAMSPIQQGLGGGSQLSFKKQTEMLSPKAILESMSTQLLGEKTKEQQEQEQKEVREIQQKISQAQQDWESYKARRSAEEQQRISQTIELKEQALKVGSYDQTSAVKSQTTQGDLSEQTIVEVAMKNAQEAREREQRARAAMSSAATPKGPQAEGGQKKTSMVAQMQSGGQESDHKLSDDKDARQRQREQAMGE